MRSTVIVYPLWNWCVWNLLNVFPTSMPHAHCRWKLSRMNIGKIKVRLIRIIFNFDPWRLPNTFPPLTLHAPSRGLYMKDNEVAQKDQSRFKLGIPTSNVWRLPKHHPKHQCNIHFIREVYDVRYKKYRKELEKGPKHLS